MEVVDLTRDLLKIPSPSGEEKQVGQFLVKRLEKNFKVKIQAIGDRFNILATKGKPNLILTTHMDTVPKQLELKEDCNYLYGRGACDAKGIIASMICAGEEATRLGINNFGILIDIGEEADFSGVKEAIKLVKPKTVIIGEPTNFEIVNGQKGLLGLKVKCTGKAAPGSTPEKGFSAINQLIDILKKIKNKRFPKDKTLGKTTLNIGKIRGGSAPNVVADYAEAIIEVRTTKPNQKILNVLMEDVPKENLTIEYSFEPILLKDVEFINNLGFEQTTVPYFTELYFWAKKSKTIVFGPGNYNFAHSDNEKISKSDLYKGKEIYLKIIKDFCQISF